MDNIIEKYNTNIMYNTLLEIKYLLIEINQLVSLLNDPTNMFNRWFIDNILDYDDNDYIHYNDENRLCINCETVLMIISVKNTNYLIKIATKFVDNHPIIHAVNKLLYLCNSLFKFNLSKHVWFQIITLISDINVDMIFAIQLYPPLFHSTGVHNNISCDFKSLCLNSNFIKEPYPFAHVSHKNEVMFTDIHNSSDICIFCLQK